MATETPDRTAVGAGGPDLRHHGDAETGSGLLDFAVNVRADTPPPWLAERIAASLGDVAAYPDPGPAREAVARRHGRDPSEVLLTAGAAEAFVLLARVLRPRRAVVVHPQFTEPEAALRAADHPVERVVLEGPRFELDPAAVPAEADLVMVGNPTNPTSVLHPAAVLERLARPGRVLVVDEAFADCVPGEAESLAGRGDLPGLVVLRSLTKTWGLAGLRAGYALADAATADALARAQPLWSVSTPALAATAACCEPRALAEADAWADRLTGRRAEFAADLADCGVHVTPGAAASFVLVHAAGGEALRHRLRDAGIAVRRGDTFPGLGPDWLRVAVRDRETSLRLTRTLAELR
ncbi:Rv2231c family pyridoxal phosphate-dependent protein CobC [Streptomonospora salina]|uniref:Aminotransferase n=1 Tax=Streptomonospora salina TaxID=104205 RepID=A0A841EBC5_9ACTN|nr:Rv2231c family pyridoxal phosphate-dependent protein CobC [Streptomonospora salina]MBB6000286.1 histidinol-phosphate aminotransferase [Streptomonospora salina]